MKTATEYAKTVGSQATEVYRDGEFYCAESKVVGAEAAIRAAQMEAFDAGVRAAVDAYGNVALDEPDRVTVEIDAMTACLGKCP